MAPSSGSSLPPLGSLRITEFLGALSAKTPAPGGGAVASTTGATAAALARMVISFSLGKKALEIHRADLTRADEALSRAADLLLALADEDAAAYARVNELSKLPETDPRRQAEYGEASAAAVAAPRATVGACCDVLRLLETLEPITNRHLRSDLAIAAILAESGARSGWWNVRVNLPLVPTEDERQRLVREMRGLIEDAAERRGRIERACEGE